MISGGWDLGQQPVLISTDANRPTQECSSECEADRLLVPVLHTALRALRNVYRYEWSFMHM
eukprot:scaffold43318_cov29-Prasinocladus_malaysianus.AAC.2